MNIRFLGTGYGECKIKKKTTRDYRKRGGVLVDDRLLIDAPADIFEAAEELGLVDLLYGVRDLLISHSHPGHFSKESVIRLAKKRKLRVFASRAVLDMLCDVPTIEGIEISSFTQFNTSAHTVAVLPTNHNTDDPNEECFNFIVMGEKNLLYALDGGWISPYALKAMKQIKLAAVIAECALELAPPSEKLMYHNDVQAVSRICGVLCDAGITDQKAKVILTHIPTSKKRSIHEELDPVAKELGLILGYDGLFVTL